MLKELYFSFQMSMHLYYHQVWIIEYDYIFLKVEEVKRFCKADQKLEFGYTYICIWGVFWAYVSLSINKEVFEAIFECFESYSHLISW